MKQWLMRMPIKAFVAIVDVNVVDAVVADAIEDIIEVRRQLCNGYELF